MPDKKLWKEWTPLERWTFLAQIAISLSLVVTVVFSYLSWREAKEAERLAEATKEQERSFWIAQNPPQLELTAGQMLKSTVGPMLFLYIKNVGDSAARSPCAEIRRLVFKPEYEDQLLSTSCNADSPYNGKLLRKGEGVTYNLPQIGYLSFDPSSIIIQRPDEPQKPGRKCSSPQHESLLVALRFTDVAGQAYRNVRQVFLCG